MDFKKGDVFFLKPYEEVDNHIGISKYTWDIIRQFPVKITHSIPKDPAVTIYVIGLKGNCGGEWCVFKRALVESDCDLTQYDIE